MKVIAMNRVEPKLVKALVDLETEAFGAGGMNEWHLVPLIRHGKIFVLLEGEAPIGAAQYMLDWEQPRTSYMVGVSIASGQRGKGLGKELLSETFRQLGQKGIEKVELTVSPDNLAAVTLYERYFGFKRVDYRIAEYGEREDRLVLELDVLQWLEEDKKKHKL